jgi:hypothetical protein
MHVILQTNQFFLFNKRSVAVFEPPARSMSTGNGEQIINPSSLMWTINARPETFALALELDALRERTHVRNPNPGSRRARLAGAVHRDDRHLDPGTGKFVTDFLKLKHAAIGLRFSCPRRSKQRRMIGGGRYCNHPARADATAPPDRIMIRGPLQTLPFKIKNPKVPAATRAIDGTF